MKKSALSNALRIRTEATPEPEPIPEPAAKAEAKKPAAKRFHTTLYLDKEFYGRVKIALIEEGKDRDFNKLVNDLLREWHEAQAE